MSNEIEITQNGAGVSEIARPKSKSDVLWCIYIQGPDDLVAMPSKPVAEAVARNFNAVWDRYGAERGHDVRAVAHVEPWMHGKEAHGKDLREHFHEYADLVLDEDAERFKPAQPVEAVGEDSREFVLRAMALNYTDRHAWDKLDTDACRRGADEIKALRAALAHPRPTGEAAAGSQHNAAYVAGEQAYFYGATFDHSNPYEKGTDGWSQWRRGWIAAASGKDLSNPEAE